MTRTLSAGQKQALAAARARRWAKRLPTDETASPGRPGDDLGALDRQVSARCRAELSATKVRIGDPVVMQREAPARGTWRRYDGRRGVVVALNRSEGEAQIRVDGAGEGWFRPGEWVPG